MDIKLYSSRSSAKLIHTDAATLRARQNVVPSEPPKLYAVPPAEGLLPKANPSNSINGQAKLYNDHAAALTEFVGRILIEKIFFQNLHIPPDLLLSLVNNVIQTVAPHQKTKVDVYHEGIVLCKQVMGKPLTAKEQKYEQASKQIDVPGEILNGLKYSALALMGSNFYTSVSSAIHQGLWNHLPAILGYGSAIAFGPGMIQAAVDNVLAYSGLTSEQKRSVTPWLNTIGRLALGFMPKVNANKEGVHYRYPSTEGHAKNVTAQSTLTVAGNKITLEQRGHNHPTAAESATGDGMQFKLHSIREITQDKIKLYMLDQAGKKITVEFITAPSSSGLEIVIRTGDKCLETFWNQEVLCRLPMIQTVGVSCQSALVLGVVASTVSDNMLPVLLASQACWPKVSASTGMNDQPVAPTSKRVMLQQEFPAIFDLATLNGNNGFSIPGGTIGEGLGFSVSTAGDINGDNISDLVLGAIYTSVNRGASYVIFGQRSPFPAVFNLTQLNGTNGFAVLGETEYGYSGYSVSSAGDINGDSIGDLVLGTNYQDFLMGASYVIFGSRHPFPAIFYVGQLNGTNGFAIPGVAAGGKLGYSVSTAGDINGDSISDLVLGASNANSNLGTCYVIFGSRSSSAATIDLAQLDGTNGFTIPGIATDGFLGMAVSSAGDINGDSIGDLVLGAAAYKNSSRGSGYVIFGSRRPFPAVFNLGHLDGINGFTASVIVGKTRLGFSISNAGDINGDNITDLVFGATRSDSTPGVSYVIFGTRNLFPALLELDQLDGINGFTIVEASQGQDHGYVVSTAGDVNGDNIADLALGAYDQYVGQGTSHVLFGSRSPFPAIFDLSQIDGSNGFSIPGKLFIGYMGTAVSSGGDINGDQVTDLVVGFFQDNEGVGASYVIYGKNTSGSQRVPAAEANAFPFTPCTDAQPLAIKNKVIQISQGQNLRLSPNDLSASCGNVALPNVGIMFNITGIENAQFQTRDSRYSWNDATIFSAVDLATGNVALIQDDSTLAPEINFTLTDGRTTLAETTADVQFNMSVTPWEVTAIHMAINRVGRTNLTPQQFQINGVDSQLDNLVFSMPWSMGGYFIAGNSDVRIQDFSYYQLRDRQIQFVAVGEDVTTIEFAISDGAGDPVLFSPLVSYIATDIPPEPPPPVSDKVIGAIAAVGVAATLGVTAIGIERYCQCRKRRRLLAPD